MKSLTCFFTVHKRGSQSHTFSLLQVVTSFLYFNNNSSYQILVFSSIRSVEIPDNMRAPIKNPSPNISSFVRMLHQYCAPFLKIRFTPYHTRHRIFHRILFRTSVPRNCHNLSMAHSRSNRTPSLFIARFVSLSP